jgi:hypothetical protein
MGIYLPDNCVTVEISTRVERTFFTQNKPKFEDVSWDTLYISSLIVIMLHFIYEYGTVCCKGNTVVLHSKDVRFESWSRYRFGKPYSETCPGRNLLSGNLYLRAYSDLENMPVATSNGKLFNLETERKHHNSTKDSLLY